MLLLSLWTGLAVWAAQPLTITADNRSRLAGQTNPPLTATYSGFVNGDTVSNLDVAVTLTTMATSNSPPGTYAIEASGAADADYVITHVNGVFTITNPVPAGFGTRAFTNATPIVIPDSGASAPYPSVINVAGLDGTLGNVTVTLRNLSHTWTRDIDVLLVGPGGQGLILCSDGGNGGANNITFTLSDSGSVLPLSAYLNNATYQPGNYLPAEVFPAPAPAAPYGTNFAVFNGRPANGNWSLFVFDGGPGDLGRFADGWSLSLTTFSAGGVPPRISTVANQTISEDGATAVLNFTVSDPETPAANLTLSGFAANPSLVPMQNFVFGGSGSNRTVVVTPAANLSGATTITLTVSDGTNYTSTNFLLTVLPVNDAPVIAGVGNQFIDEDTATGLLSFTVADVETTAGNLMLTGGSSNPALAPINQIVFGGSAGNRTALVTPAPDAHGTSVITLTVSDGTNSASTSFVLTVHPRPDFPTISSVADQVINEDGTLGPLAVLVSSVDLDPQILTLSGGSSNPSLLPTNRIVFGGTGSNRTVTLAPVANASGTSVVTLAVSDGTNSASTSFLVTVNPVNDAPLIGSVGDQVINEDGFAGPLFFLVSDLETPAASLVLSASSSNPVLMPL
ncbi:MAG TPA: MBG domain-containing protein, partial [Vicinamibacterales bacterium]|nr:MBG domain-containing protein [Vicinamibacterales bacterium]